MMQRRVMNVLAALLMVTLLVAVAVPNAMAFEEREGDDVIIGADEVINDDLFVGAENLLQIDGTVNGDVLGGATTVEINGTIDGDLFTGGQTVIINGTVTGNVYVGGQMVEVNGEIGRDLMGGAFLMVIGSGASIGGDFLGGGYSLVFQPESAVEDDIYAGGQQMALDGEVAGDVLFGGAALRLDGPIGGDVYASVGDAGAQSQMPFEPDAFFPPELPETEVLPWGLNLGDGAEIAGNLNYQTSVELDIPSGAVAGDVTFEEITPPETDVNVRVDGGGWLWRAITRPIGRFIALVVIGLLLAWLVPAVLNRTSTTVAEQALPSLGWGALVGLLFFPVMLLAAALVLLASFLTGLLSFGQLGGVVSTWGMTLLGLVMLVFFFVWNWLAPLMVSGWLGRTIFQRFNPEMADHRVWPLVLGVAVVVIITAIPFLGWLVGLLISLVGLGVVFLVLRDRSNNGVAPEAVPAAMPPAE